MVRPVIIAGNWKLNPRRAGGEDLFRSVCEGVVSRGVPDSIVVAVFPPSPYLGLLASEQVRVGAQDVSIHGWGAHTGELGAELLSDFGINDVIVGHSERRQEAGESSELVGHKARVAIEAGLHPIVCVGETESERDANRTFDVIGEQLDQVTSVLPGSASMTIAYEPVWAIGTGRTATPEMAQEAHAFLRGRLRETRGDAAAESTSILYGGSVKPGNARELLQQGEIDGALIGGASLEAESFLAILDAALEQE